MKNRPIPLKIFALLQILVPVFSLAYNAFLTGLPITTYTSLFVQSRTPLELVEFFAFFPLAGVAVLMMKSWTYPVYLAVVGWAMFTNTLVWAADYSTSLMVLVGANAFNLLCTAYYLHPQVRKVFFDSKVKWWETAPRYLANIGGVLINNDLRKDCEIVNISRGGALLKTDWQPDNGESVNLNFELNNKKVDVEAKVVHMMDGSFGVQFVNSPRPSSWDTSTIDSTLRKMDLPIHHPAMSFGTQLRNWMDDVKHGRGLVPNL